MIIRPETPADYPAVARLNVRAFDERMDEAVIVTLLRQRAAYTPALALVAEVDGMVAGHALFTPVSLRLLGEDVPAVLLAPLAVDPALQKRGIGGALMAAGHAAAREHGATLALLLGHPDYYPRFGYQMQAFGSSSLTVDAASLPAAEPLAVRKPAEADLPALLALWAREEGDVDFSLRPEESLVDWLSPNPQITAAVYRRGDSLVGYSRVHQAAPAEPRMFLAADAEAAQAMAHQLAAAAGGVPLHLPLHPDSASAAALGAAVVHTYDPAMALALGPSPFADYLAAVRAGQQRHGRPLWPTAFDLP